MKVSLNPYPLSQQQPCYMLRWWDPVMKKDCKRSLYMPKKQAERERDLKHAELLEIKSGVRRYSNTVSLSHMKDLYLKWVKNNRNSRTHDRYKIGIKNFQDVVGDPQQLTPLHFETYKSAHPLRSPVGINTDMRAVRSMLNWSWKIGGLLKRDDVPYIEFYKEPDPIPKFLTNDEIKTILTHKDIPQDTKDMIEVYLLTGARSRELLKANFTWDDVKHTVILGRGNKQHKVILSKRVVEIFDKWRVEGRNSPIPYTYTYIKKRCVKASEISEIKITAHDLRRTAGAIIYRATKDIYATKEFLGHRKIQTTTRWYAGLMEEEREELSAVMSQGLADILE